MESIITNFPKQKVPRLDGLNDEVYILFKEKSISFFSQSPPENKSRETTSEIIV